MRAWEAERDYKAAAACASQAESDIKAADAIIAKKERELSEARANRAAIADRLAATSAAEHEASKVWLDLEAAEREERAERRLGLCSGASS